MTPATAAAVAPGLTADELAEAQVLLDAPAAMDHVTIDLGGRRVLDDVTFPIRRGKINVLIGPSGVGKTVTAKTLVKLITPTYGRTLAEGRDLRRMSAREEGEWLKRLSVMLQGPSLFTCGLFASLSALDNVAFPLRDRTRTPEDEILERSWALMRDLGMMRRAHAPIGELSGGELRRVALARALVSESELVIIDDVESGVDHVRLRGMIELIAARQLEQRNTYLITTNEPEVARRLADELIVMRAGRIVEAGGATSILRRRDAFGRRLMDGDPASGLAMLDEVGASEFQRARSQWGDYDARVGILFCVVCVLATVLMWAYTTQYYLLDWLPQIP